MAGRVSRIASIKGGANSGRQRLPFRIDPASGVTLTEQMKRGLRKAVFSGYWTKRLPSRAELSALFGVSDNVVRAAVSALASEGLVRPRRRLGCEILHSHRRTVSGRVLYVLPEDVGSYMTTVFEETFRQHLAAAGFACTAVTVPGGGYGHPDWSGLDMELRNSYDLAVFWGSGMSGRALMRRIRRTSIPYFVLQGRANCGKGNCVGSFAGNAIQAYMRFVGDCRARNVRSVCLCGCWTLCPGLGLLEKYLQDAGIMTERIDLPAVSSLKSLESCQRLAHAALWARQERGPLCDLVYFGDDYILMGALTALLEKGVRIPEDVRLVSVYNEGFGPVISKSIAKIAYDSESSARVVGDAAIDWLRTGKMTPDGFIGPTYVRGETFP